jgi:hypothetical protein
LNNRRDKRYLDTSQDVVEVMTVVTGKPLQLKTAKRKFYAGTNQTNMIGPVAVPPAKDQWKATFGEKKTLLGHMRFAVGGPTEGLQLGSDGATAPHNRKRQDDDVEPVAYHSNSTDFWGEIIHSFNIGACCEQTTLDPALAYACILAEIPYAGVVPTEAMKVELREQLIMKVMDGFTDETNITLYDPMAVSAMFVDKKPADKNHGTCYQKRPLSHGTTTETPPFKKPKPTVPSDTVPATVTGGASSKGAGTHKIPKTPPSTVPAGKSHRRRVTKDLMLVVACRGRLSSS